MSVRIRKKDFIEVENVKWLQGGLNYFDELYDRLRQAEESIYVHTYILQPDDTGNEFMEIVKEASERGVKVQVLIDGFGSDNITSQHMDDLREAGVEIRKYSRLFISGRVQLGRRLHQKIAVIDRKYTLVGGINISNNYSGRNREYAWLDFAAGVESEAFGKFSADVCNRKYQRKLTSKVNRLDSDWEQYDRSKYHAQLVRNDWLKGKIEITKTYNDAIKKAQDRILITGSYFLPDVYIRRKLSKAAKRGVKITMVFSEHSDVPFMKHATRYLYHWLIKHDIELLEWKPSTIHGKVIVVDDYFMSVGSYNINPLSKFGGIEMNVNVVSEKVAQSFLSHWDEKIRQQCDEIQPQRIAKKYSMKYFKQMAAYYYANVLFRFVKMFDQL